MNKPELKAMKGSQTTGDLRGLSAKESAVADIKADGLPNRCDKYYYDWKLRIKLQSEQPTDEIITITLK